MREPITLACAAFVYMGFAMWATQPAQSCELPGGAQRRLYLDRVMDRELIARQARRIHEISSREAQRSGAAEGTACEARLAAELAARHELPVEAVDLAVDGVR